MTGDHQGEAWTEREEQALVLAFVLNHPVERLAKEHGRTPMAVTTRLVRLGHLALVNGNYHRVDPRPWVLTPELRKAQARYLTEQETNT